MLKGSLSFFYAGKAPFSYAGKAPYSSSMPERLLSSNAGKAPYSSLMQERLLILLLCRQGSFFYAGKAPYSSLMQQGLMQEKLHILSSRGPSDLKRHLPRAALALACIYYWPTLFSAL